MKWCTICIPSGSTNVTVLIGFFLKTIFYFMEIAVASCYFLVPQRSKMKSKCCNNSSTSWNGFFCWFSNPKHVLQIRKREFMEYWTDEKIKKSSSPFPFPTNLVRSLAKVEIAMLLKVLPSARVWIASFSCLKPFWFQLPAPHHSQHLACWPRNEPC